MPEELKRCNNCNKALFDSYCTIYDGETYAVKYHICDRCRQEEDIQEYKKTGEIGNRLWLEASSCAHHTKYDDQYRNLRDSVREFFCTHRNTLIEIFQAMEEVDVFMKEFEIKHWLSWIRNFYNTAEAAGHEYQTETISMLLGGSCGRAMITVRNKKSQAQITMIFDDSSDKPRGGIQSVMATKEEAIALLREAMDMPVNSFAPNNNVSIL